MCSVDVGVGVGYAVAVNSASAGWVGSDIPDIGIESDPGE